MKLARNLAGWVDQRTGLGALVRAALYEHIPGGARWRYVWGSTLVFCFSVQMITGFFLWMHYSPSSTTAWESVYYVQYQIAGGWLLRGIHHYTAQVMIVLLALHVLQIIIDGAYRAPREFNFWVGIVLLKIVLALGLTGYLLPWDQKGYWATRVATNIAGTMPVFGTELRELIVGGSEYGHHTLTRFFALHAGLLPLLMIVFTGIHIMLLRRHGIHGKTPIRKPDSYFWPDQVLKDGVACLAVLAVVLFLACQHWIFEAGHRGAPLSAPADPSEPYAAARPDWYFLFLFQLLHFFEGETEIWGSLYIPGIVMGVLFLMPIIARWRCGHGFNVAFTFAILIGVGALTWIAISNDANDPEYIAAVERAEAAAERVVELAEMPTGIPPAGAVRLLRSDPKTQGPALFARYCASCHRYDGHDGLHPEKKFDEAPSASDLRGYGGRAWLAGFFDPERIVSEDYFGGTALADGTMVDWVVENVGEFSEEEEKLFQNVITTLAVRADLPAESELNAAAADSAEFGAALMGKDAGEHEGFNCVKCHDPSKPGRAPDLSNWGSREWLIDFVSDPSHRRFYGRKNDRMPSFGAKGILDRKSIELIVDFVRGDWFEADDGGGWWARVKERRARLAANTPMVANDAEDDAGGDASDSETSVGDASPEPTPADSTTTPAAPARSVDFATEVKPILERHCLKCHGGGRGKPKGGFSLKSKATAFEPGDFGEPTLVPGNRTESAVYTLISSDDEDERMPPEDKAPALTDEQIETIGAWIDAGAKWPDGAELEAVE